MKTYRITVNGVAYDVAVEETSGAGGAAVAAAPITAPATISAPQPATAPAPAAASAPAPAAPPAPKAAPQGGTRVESPLPGTVLDYKVQEGAAVTKGQVVALIEAMKMENEIVSPCDGTVAAIVKERGDSVNPGDLLMTIQ